MAYVNHSQEYVFRRQSDCAKRKLTVDRQKLKQNRGKFRILIENCESMINFSRGMKRAKLSDKSLGYLQGFLL